MIDRGTKEGTVPLVHRMDKYECINVFHVTRFLSIPISTQIASFPTAPSPQFLLHSVHLPHIPPVFPPSLPLCSICPLHLPSLVPHSIVIYHQIPKSARLGYLHQSCPTICCYFHSRLPSLTQSTVPPLSPSWINYSIPALAPPASTMG